MTLKNGIPAWLRNEELMYSIFFTVIIISLIFWPLLNSIATIAMFLYWLFMSKKQFQGGRAKWVLLFSLLYVLVVLGGLYSENVKEALFKVQQKSPLLLFPLVMGTTSVVTRTVFTRTMRSLVLVTFIACAFCVGYGFFMYFKEGTTFLLSGYPVVFVLKDMSPFIMGLCCFLSLSYQLIQLQEAYARGENPRYLDLFMALFLFLFLFLLGNRNILICMSAVFIYFSFRLIPRMVHRLSLIAGLAVIMVLTIVFNPYLNRQWKDLVDFSEENSIQLDEDSTLGRGWGGKTIRLAIWECSMDVVKKNWLAGVGAGDVQDVLQQAYENRKFYFASRYNRYNAHNQYIQETLASGLPGLIIFSCGIFLPLLHNIIRKKNTLYTLFLLSFAFICITESILEISKGVVWYSFFNALFIFRKS